MPPAKWPPSGRRTSTGAASRAPKCSALSRPGSASSKHRMIATLALQSLPPEAEALRSTVRAFLDEALAGLPADRRARSWLGFDAAFSRELGKRGWIGLALPQAYGGG